MEVTVQIVSTEGQFVRFRPERNRILLMDPHSTVFQSRE